MTSKLLLKTSKKDRPRSSDKVAGNKSGRRSKGGGTPDNKAASPLDLSAQNGNLLSLESPDLNQTELDKEIRSLRINPKDLKSTTAPSVSKREYQSTNVLVKKEIMVFDSPKQHKRITVARRAPSSAEIKLSNPEDYPGLRLDVSGRIITHSILGSVDDFVEQAAKTGDEANASVKKYYKPSPSPWPEDEPQNDLSNHSKTTGQIRLDETRALDNWERQMKIRRKEQQHLSDTMNVPPDMLLMNQDGDFRTKQEERTLIDRAIPAMDYGKGYRVGSEFWKQVEAVGGEKGINMTLTQTERGYAPPMEHIGRPDLMRKSMGTDWTETRRMAYIHYPWLKSEYLQERKGQLINVINDMIPHKPYIDGLEVIGESLKDGKEMNNNENEDDNDTLSSEITEYEEELRDPLADYEDVFPLPIFGPSLTINGYSAQWKDVAAEQHANNGLHIRLHFNSEVGSKSSNSIDITNDGTAAIYFSWKKIPAKDPFGIKNSRPLQRFYFDIRNGVILPNDSIKIPFTFKSQNAGIFNETWQLETQPVLCGGGPISVTLRGISCEEDKLAEKRRELEEELQRRQKSTFIREIVEEIFNGVRTPPRPSTPIDSYLTEEELFSRQNNKMNFNTEAVTDLKDFHQQLNPEEEWDMNINTLLQEARITEDEEAKETLIQKLNEDVEMFAFKTEDPVQRSNHNFCYQLLCEAVDVFYLKAGNLRKSMGLPEKEFVLEVQQEEVPKKSKKGQSQETQKATNDKKLDSKKKESRPTSSRGKASGNQKTRTKEGPSSSVASPKQLNVDTVSARHSAFKTRPERPPPSNPLEIRYSENLYIQLYDLLRNVAGRIEESI